MKAARIVDGAVFELFPLDKAGMADRLHADLVAGLVDVPDDTIVGSRLLDGTWQAPATTTAEPTTDDVRAEARRRMRGLLGARDDAHLDILIANGTREAVRLLGIRSTREWTPAEAMRASQLADVDAVIEAIRAASNAMEAEPPRDFASDARWP